MTLLLLAAGLLLLVLGAELLVRGASSLAARMGLSPLMIGLTVVAFGTSSPELAVSLKAALSGAGGVDLAMGNVLGSNIFNVLVILGLAAMATPLIVSRLLVRVDVPIMIGVSVLLALFALNGRIARLEGLAMVLGMVAYTGLAIRLGKVDASPDAKSLTIAEEHPPSPGTSWVRSIGTTLLGLGLLVLGSDWLVQGAVSLATRLGVSKLMIGLTIVAAGTSLPELATSVMASLRGQRDMAVGNVVGSGIFNILGVLGLSALLSDNGILVQAQSLRMDIPVLLGSAVACLPIFLTGHTITRLEGIGLVASYLIYLGLLMLDAGQHPAFGVLRSLALFGIFPLLLILLFGMTWRQTSKSRCQAATTRR